MGSRSDTVKTFIADLARPFQQYAAACSGAWATVEIAHKVTDASQGAIVLGVIAGWSTALFTGKAFEVANIAKHNAAADVARSAAAPPPPRPGTAVITAAGDVTVDAEITDNTNDAAPAWAKERP